jgi:hypothetical protein
MDEEQERRGDGWEHFLALNAPDVKRKARVLDELGNVRAWQQRKYAGVGAEALGSWECGLLPSHITIFNESIGGASACVASRVSANAILEGLEEAVRSAAAPQMRDLSEGDVPDIEKEKNIQIISCGENGRRPGIGIVRTTLPPLTHMHTCTHRGV